MMNNIKECDPYVLGTIIDKYRKRNKELEKRESAMIKILANIDREKSNTSEIEDKIRTAISDSKNFDHDIRAGSWSTHSNLRADSSEFYPRLSGRTDSYMPLPALEHDRFGRGLDLDSKHLSSSSSWRKCPKKDVNNLFSERGLSYSNTTDEHYGQLLNDSSLDTFGHSYGGVFMSDSKRDCVREASPKGRSRRHEDGDVRIRRKRDAMRSDADVERLLDPNVPCDASDSDLSSIADSMASIDAEPKRTFADNKRQSRGEQKDELNDYMKDFISPSIQEMMHSYEERHTDPRARDGYKRNVDCDPRSRPECVRRIAFEENSRPATRQKDERGSLFPATTLKSRRRIITTGRSSSSPSSPTTLDPPFSDLDKDTSIESMSRRTKTDLKSNHLASFDCSRKISKSQHSNLSDRKEGAHSNQSSVHSNLDPHDIECETYEFDENYSNNYLKFLIRNCMPKSLLRSEYNSSYNWSTENKQDIFNRIEEIELIKKIICEELDYRECINKPFKLHRNDRRFLLRNIMYSEAVKLALSKGLPICGVMALFAVTGSAENIKQLTLQTIRQANELLGESHPDPSGLDNIVSAAEKCVLKLAQLDKKTGTLNSSKLCKILQDVVSRETILDPRENLEKCIDELTSLQVVDDVHAFDEVDSLRSEVCRTRNIIWSVEEHAALKTRRENTEDVENSTQNKSTTNKHVARGNLTKEQDRLMREVARMKSLVHELEHNAIPCAINRKKEAERLTAQETSFTDESLPSSDSYENTQQIKSTENVDNDRRDKQTRLIPEITVASVTSPTGSASEVTETEHESLRNELDRLRFLVENMERRLVVGANESEYIRKNNVNDLETASEENRAHPRHSRVSTKTCPNTERQLVLDGNASEDIEENNVNDMETASEENTAHPRQSRISTKTCSCTQTTHSCSQTNKNNGHVHTRVIYLVANKGEEVPSNVVKHCIRRKSQMVTKSITNNLQNDTTPNTVSYHTAIQKVRPAVILALTSNTENESEHEQVESTTQKSDDSVCTTRPCENVGNSTSRNLSVIPETSDVFVSALSIPCVFQSTDATECTSRTVEAQQVSGKSACSNVTGKTTETEDNKMISKGNTTNPAESMWENMVHALVPGIASKRRPHAGEGTQSTAAASDSEKADSSSHLTSNPKEADDQCSNKQSEEICFKIIHKSGSAYEISSSALNENDQTPDTTSGEVCKKDLADDLPKSLALAVKICKGPEATAESLKEAFRESYVATCEKAINEALKDIINSYSLGSCCDGKANQLSKSKKTSKKRPVVELDDTILSDYSSQYTRDDIVIVGTTKMNNGRNAANNLSFTTAVSNSSKKKHRAMAAMQQEEIVSVSYEPSNTTLTLVTKDEKECRGAVHEDIRTTIIPSVTTTSKDQASTTTGKGVANRIEYCYSPKMKIAKASLALRGRRVCNKSEPSNGFNVSRKKNIAVGTNKATKKTVRHFKLTSKDGNKMPSGDKIGREFSPGRKNVKSASFRQETSNETSISKGIRSRKAPCDINAEVAVLFDGADRMEDKESNENAAVFDAEETSVVGDQTQNKTPEMDCNSALKTVSRFEIGQEYKKAMIHVKNCPNCTKKLLPTLLQVVNKVEDMTRKCENPATSKNNNLKGNQEQENKHPHAFALRGKTR